MGMDMGNDSYYPTDIKAICTKILHDVLKGNHALWVEVILVTKDG